MMYIRSITTRLPCIALLFKFKIDNFPVANPCQLEVSVYPNQSVIRAATSNTRKFRTSLMR